MQDVMRSWPIGLGGFLLGLLALASKDWLVSKVKLLLDFLYGRFAGSRLLRRAALAKYTRELYRRHKEFPVSFQADEALKLPMESVYVPLYGAGTTGGEARAALSTTLRRARRSVVLGVPGAGKTLLLRHESLMWAQGRVQGDSSRVELGDVTDIPVLLELHRLNTDPELSLEQHVVRHFARHGFPRADTWVAGALDRGDLALYFDGLDEVATDLRGKAVELIKEFADTYADCRIVVTCRVAVYEGQFAEFDQTLRVRHFDEHLIRRFLNGWPWRAGTATDTVDQVLGALRDTPQIMSLARNPLLLTMIAYLYDFVYAGTDQVLPHTRADFYKQVIGSLLADRRQSSFALPLKKSVLQQLALAAQDIPSGTHDRLALPEAEVLKTARTVLEQQGRDPALAENVVKEIVERSGLLLAVDNGERYQFAHLTLQEYLAAAVLAANPAGLLRRYEADPVAWREAVRLWCGVEPRDCTEVVRAVYGRDPVLAFQCLADAYAVDDGLAEEVLEHFKARLCAGEADEQVISAFGLVAGDRRQRGLRLFEFLKDTVGRATTTSARRYAPARAPAARALAATNLPKAAEVLASRAHPENSAWRALASMGDLAVPAFRAAAEAYPNAVHVLWSIRTPKAARALAGLLWHRNPETELLCAFHLGELLTVPEIEADLRTVPVPENYSYLGWVWRPFAQGSDDMLIKVAGRIAWIINESLPVEPGGRNDLPTPDRRIIAALAVVDHLAPEEHERLNSAVHVPNELADWIERRGPSALLARNRVGDEPVHLSRQNLSYYLQCDLDSFSSFVVQHSDAALVSAGLSPHRLTLVRMLPDWLQLRVAVALLRQTDFASPQSWDALPPGARTSTSDYAFGRHWHLWFTLLMSLAGSAVAAWGALQASTGDHPWGPAWLGAVAVAQIVVGWLVLALYPLRGGHPFKHWWYAMAGWIPAILVYFYAALTQTWGTSAAIIVTALAIAAFLAVTMRMFVLADREDTATHPVREYVLMPLI